MIAVGIFLTPADDGPDARLARWACSLVWAVMGRMALCGALCYGELAARYPQAGGGYVYLREAYGPRVAFLYGWKCLLVMDPGITAALATGLRQLRAPTSCRSGTSAARLVAVAAIAAFAAVHIAGRAARRARC